MLKAVSRRAIDHRLRSISQRMLEGGAVKVIDITLTNLNTLAREAAPTRKSISQNLKIRGQWLPTSRL